MSNSENQWLSFNPLASEQIITIRVRQVKELCRTLTFGTPNYSIYLSEADSQGNKSYALTKETYTTIKEWLEEIE